MKRVETHDIMEALTDIPLVTGYPSKNAAAWFRFQSLRKSNSAVNAIKRLLPRIAPYPLPIALRSGS